MRRLKQIDYKNRHKINGKDIVFSYQFNCGEKCTHFNCASVFDKNDLVYKNRRYAKKD